MALAAGTRIEHYEIIAAIGAGGMGDVYRARDTKLGRDVAFKVLREMFSSDPDRLGRFQREAKVLAVLNHSNVAQIYGVAGADGAHGIVMELVEGDTLQARLKGGALAIDEALPIARQVADALEAAHDHGIVHRDLKPGNIMVNAEGRVKVLDFGLAKVVDPHPADADLSHSPTMMSARFTEANVLIGTAAYMSPEQARGKVADERSDVWAFGCVLYEMLAGQQPFTGETITDLMGGIVRVDPDWNRLPRATPPAVQALIKRCLQKDRKQRYQAIGDLRHDLEEALRAPATVAGAPASRRERIAWAVAALLALTTIGTVVGATYFAPRSERAVTARFLMTLPPEAPLGPSPVEPLPTVSPDGRYVAFRTGAGGGSRLWLRPVGSLAAQLVPGTEVVSGYAFWSADSRYIAFFATGELKKVAAAGGPPQTLCDAAGGSGTWNQDDVILFEHQGALHRVAAAGGSSVAIRTPDKSRNEVRYSWPSFLPDGRHFLYVAVNADAGRTEIRATTLDSGADTPLFTGNSRVLYANPNHLLFVREGTLMAQPFDPQRLALTGAAFPIAETVGFVPQVGVAAFGVSANGTLAFRVASIVTASELTWFDRSGKNLGTVRASGNFSRPVFAPDQNRVVGEKREGASSDIWVMDLSRGTSSRFTFDPADDLFPIFSRDGKHIAFASNRGDGLGVYVKPATGVGAEQLLQKVQGAALGIADWSPDGQLLLYNVLTPDNAYDTVALPLAGDKKPYPVLNQKYNEYRTRFSPDGKWILYTSNETGREEIYVQAFPPSGGKWQVSVDGGVYGYWRQDGKEIIFDSPDRRVMAVDVKLGPTFEAGIPRQLFEIPSLIVGQRLGVTADAQKFLVPMAPQSSDRPALRIVLNWMSDIKP